MKNTTRYTVFIGNSRTEQRIKTFPQEQYECAKAYARMVAENHAGCLYDHTQTACDHWYSEDSGIYVEIRSERC